MAKLSIHVFGFNLSAEVSKARTSYDMSREMADSIKKTCIEAIRKEKRQGGSLYDP